MYSEKKMIFLFLIICLVEFSIGRKLLPSYATKCKYTTDKVELGNCIMKSYAESKHLILKGIPYLHVPVIDPYFLEEVHFSLGESDSPINLQITLTNISMTGIKTMVLSNVTLDLENPGMTGETFFPQFDLKSTYKIVGKILVVPLDSIGNCDIKLVGVSTQDKYRGKKVTRKGKEYIDFSEGETEINIAGRSSAYFDNLINGNPQLTESTNAVLNENQDEFKNELTKILSATLYQVRLAFLHSVFGLVALEDLFEK